jgi:polysaccharide pyruvyl transferase WcaK-like protein
MSAPAPGPHPGTEPGTDPALDAAGVRLGFQLVLRRPPENERVVAHYVGLGLSLRGFLSILMESDEFMERQRRLLTRGDLDGDPPAAPPEPAARRVLLFGAYGNGNVGDAAQIDALAGLLRRLAPVGTPPGFAACSWEHLAPYCPAGITALRPDALMRPENVRPRAGATDGGGADLVVIGGGGLFGAPHFPLHERRWAEWFVGRAVPFALLGIGGSAEALGTPGWNDAYRLLLGHAAFVGVRDAETLAAARAIRPDATWFPDPVLAEALLSQGEPGAAGERDLDAVLIPRAPNGAADQAALDGLLELAWGAGAAGRRVVIAALEPAADRDSLAGEEVRYIAAWPELLDLCRRSHAVVSARLHGVVAGLVSGCAVHGLAQPKTGDLMARFGIADWFHPSGWPDRPPDLSPAAAARFHATLAPGLARFRAEIDAAMAAAGGQLSPFLTDPRGARRR